MSKIVAFTVKSNDMIILFACLVGWLNSLLVEIKKKSQSLKNCVGLCLGWYNYRRVHASARACAHAHVLTRATILGPLFFVYTHV